LVRQAATIETWAAAAGVTISEALVNELRDGFGNRADGEDRFDAVVGLLGMVQVVLGQRQVGEPEDPEVRAIEGWIFGQDPSAAVSGAQRLSRTRPAR
jgi:hypothetical protein